MASEDVTRVSAPKATRPDCPTALTDGVSLDRLRGERDPALYTLTLHGPSLTHAGRQLALSLGLEVDCDVAGCWYVVDLFEDLASCFNCASLMARESAEYSYVERDRGVCVEMLFCGRCNR